MTLGLKRQRQPVDYFKSAFNEASSDSFQSSNFRKAIRTIPQVKVTLLNCEGSNEVKQEI